jgi:hypothetical protein
METNNTPERKNWVSKYLVGQVLDPFREAARNLGGAILEFPFKILDKAVNGTIQWTHDAVANIVGFPTKHK